MSNVVSVTFTEEEAKDVYQAIFDMSSAHRRVGFQRKAESLHGAGKTLMEAIQRTNEAKRAKRFVERASEEPKPKPKKRKRVQNFAGA